MPKPVFIIGWGRSGTTWLGNLLQQHPQIAAVTGDELGIFESIYFYEVEGRYGDIAEPCNFVELASVLAQSFYFRQAGATLENLLARFPMGYTELFVDVMDEFARANDCQVWIEKTPGHTLIASRLAKTIPEARFILIERDLKSVIRSRLKILQVIRKHLGIRAGNLKTALKVAEWTLARQHHLNCGNRVREKYPERLLSLRYEDLLAETENVMRQNCKFLGLEFDPAMCESPFQTNSSMRWVAGDVFQEPPQWMLGGWLNFCDTLGKWTPAFLLSAAHWLGATLSKGLGKQPLAYFFFEDLDGAPQAPQHERW